MEAAGFERVLSRLQIFAAGLVLTTAPRAASAPAKHDIPDTIALQCNLAYRQGKSSAWRLDLAFPKNPGSQARPGLVIIHGGGWIEGDKSSFSSLSGAVQHGPGGRQ